MDNDTRYIDDFTEEQVKSFYKQVYRVVEAAFIVLLTLFYIIFTCVVIAFSVIIGVLYRIVEYVIAANSSKNKS